VLLSVRIAGILLLPMKKDQGLLAAIGAAAALALTFAAARGALPVLDVFNPLENWPWRKSAVAFAIVLAAAVLSMVAIVRSDRGLAKPSATLEWVYSSETASTIVGEYGEHRLQALRGVLLDSIAFIPSYVLLIAIVSFWIAQGWTSQRWAAWTVAAGWSAAFAGAFDYLENAGIYAALGGVTTRLAPVTYAACQLKWVLAYTAADFAIIAAIARFAGR
jgi:hypothetical protein